MKLPRLLIYLVTIGLIFVALVFYNYRVSRSRLSSDPSLFSVKILEYPNTLKAGESGNFNWQVDTNSSFNTNLTTIYWGYESSPSAFTNLVTPPQAGYPNLVPDYSRGEFKLPDQFQANLSFNQPGNIYFRAYARINDRNYWSPEYTLEVK